MLVTATRLPSLQVLRFLAAFAVLLFHVGSGLAVEYESVSNPFALGWIGVDVFFVLSGFIMVYATDPSQRPAQFFLRRIARIVPLYWFLTLGLIGVALIMPQFLNSTQITAEAVWKSFLFIPYEKANGAIQPILFLGWTLCYEMFFYAIFAVSLLAGRYAPQLASVTLIAIVLAGQLWPSETVLVRFYTNPIILEFVWGMALYYIYATFRPGPNGSAWAFAFLLAAAAAAFMALSGYGRFISIGIPAALTVAAFLYMPFREGRVLALFVLLGDASYSLYLSHPYIIQLPIKVMGDQYGLPLSIVVASAAALVATAFSVLLFYAIEKPAQRSLLRRFRRLQRDTSGAEAART